MPPALEARGLRKAFAGTTVVDGVDLRCEAGNGIEALKAMREGVIDLMLLDWNMPDLNGIDLAEKLKAAGIKLKFGFVTTETSEEMRQRALGSGALFLVGKPFTPESLQSALAQAGV